MIIYCPHCNQDFEVEKNWIGKKANCTNCNQDFTVSMPVICPACTTPNPVNAPNCLKCQKPMFQKRRKPVAGNSDCDSGFTVEVPNSRLRFWSMFPIEMILIFFPLEFLALKLDISLIPKYMLILLLLGTKFALLKLVHNFCWEIEDTFHSVFVFFTYLCATATGFLIGYGLVACLLSDIGEGSAALLGYLPITLIHVFGWGIFAETEKKYMGKFIALLIGLIGEAVGLIISFIK